jgi:hypothetical protein
MATTVPMSPLPLPQASWPDHRGLPCEDPREMKTALEHPQAMLLTEAFRRHLERSPDGSGFIAADVGIYFTYVPDDPLRGCKPWDWFFVPGVSSTHP